MLQRLKSKYSIPALFAVVLAVYWPALHAGFVWNDADYVTRPELESLRGLWRIWTEARATEQYYPLLHSFFWLQHRLWGDAPFGYHLVNVLLHATAACLVGAVVRQLLEGREVENLNIERRTLNTERRIWDYEMRPDTAAMIAAALFALHPVMVESVAWISEQKNTLSTVFYLWAGLVYLRFERERTKALAASATSERTLRTKASAASATRSETRRAFRSYSAATVLFLAALLSKSVTASLPAAILVVLWWKRGRLEKRDVLPLVPWFVAGAAVGLFTAWVEHNYIGAQGADFQLTLLDRGVLAGRIIWFYLTKLFWPSPLIFIYPRWEVSASDPVQWIYPIGAIVLLVGLWLLRHRTRGPLAAYLFFVGSLFPTLGFFNVYAFQFSFVADHWQYLPAIGVLVMVAGGVAAKPGAAASLASAAVLVLFAVLSFRQTGGYHDITTFYNTTLARNPSVWMAHNNLGLLADRTGHPEEAIERFATALRLKPDFPEAESNLGAALMEMNRKDDAIAHFEAAIRLKPTYAEAHFNLGMALRDIGKREDAIAQFQEVVRLQPTAEEAFEELAATLSAQDQSSAAIDALASAVKLRPGDSALHERLGALLASAGRPDDSIAQFRAVVQLDGSRASAHFNLGLILAQSGHVAAAVPEFREAVRLAPNDINTRMKLAQALSETGQAGEAQAQVAEAQRLRALGAKP